MPEKKFSLLLIILSAIFILISILPLLHVGFIETHDRNLYPIWLFEFDQGIRAGKLFPRWVGGLLLGYGAPLFNFTQPLFYYLAETVHLIGFNLVSSIEIVIALGFILGFVSMYLFGKTIWGRDGGFLAAVIYTFFPYRLALVYLRGAFAEFFATALIPLILYLAIKLIQTKNLIYLLFCSLLFALLLLCHNIQALFFLPFFLFYIILVYWQEIKKNFILIIAPLLIGLGLAAFFTLPAFFELQYITYEELITKNNDFHNNFLNFSNLIFPRWDSVHYFQIGVIGIFIFLFTLYLIISKRKNFESNERKNIYFFTAVIIITTLLLLPLSTIFWEKVPLVKFIQFPWRLLSFQALALAVLSGVLLRQEITKLFFKKISQKFIVVFFAIIIVLVNLVFLHPAGYLPILPKNNYSAINWIFGDVNAIKNENENTITLRYNSIITTSFMPHGVIVDKFMDYFQNNLSNLIQSILNEEQWQKFKKVEVLSGSAHWEIMDLKPHQLKLKVNSYGESSIAINQFWFPGWQAKLDGEKIAINHNNDFQIMTFVIPQGEHNLQIRFTNTPIRMISNLISLFTLVIWLLFFVKYLKKRKKA